MKVIIIFNSIFTNEGDNNFVLIGMDQLSGQLIEIDCDDLCFSYKLQNELNKF